MIGRGRSSPLFASIQSNRFAHAHRLPGGAHLLARPGFFEKHLTFMTEYDTVFHVPSTWGYSSAGRALEWHSRGQGFDPPYLHQKSEAHICVPRIFRSERGIETTPRFARAQRVSKTEERTVRGTVLSVERRSPLSLPRRQAPRRSPLSPKKKHIFHQSERALLLFYFTMVDSKIQQHINKFIS